MKKILVLYVLIFFSMPVIAVCSITGGACSAPVNFESSSLKDRVVPNNLKNIQRTDAFRPKIVEPIGSPNIRPVDSSIRPNPQASDYDADCQSGICLPENEN